MLPMEPAAAGEVSLDYHLTLEAIRSGQGNEYHLGSIAQALFTSMQLSRTQRVAVREGLFSEAKEAVLRVRRIGRNTGVWSADATAYSVFGEILTLFDCQLAVVPLSELQFANAQLQKVFSASLAPRLAHQHDDVSGMRMQEAKQRLDRDQQVERKKSVLFQGGN
ncbi:MULTISPECIES: Fis family transcriptional regulator [unclassified Caballeronia]|uniref:Fis family transcriptional regulator n=2 Tax=unclassified Caballeronia TaxID=2646786 RepID=UPI002027BB2E|nr:MULTISPECIES: Fis family transcriptional regulator [unclassified Caballeronia]